MQESGFIKYFVILGVILAVVFLSQQVDLFGRHNTFTFVNSAVEKAKEYTAIGTGWFTDQLMPNIGEEAQRRGEMVAEGVVEEVNKQKEKATESVTKKIQNYFSGIADAILHPRGN